MAGDGNDYLALSLWILQDWVRWEWWGGDGGVQLWTLTHWPSAAAEDHVPQVTWGWFDCWGPLALGSHIEREDTQLTTMRNVVTMWLLWSELGSSLPEWCVISGSYIISLCLSFIILSPSSFCLNGTVSKTFFIFVDFIVVTTKEGHWLTPQTFFFLPTFPIGVASF